MKLPMILKRVHFEAETLEKLSKYWGDGKDFKYEAEAIRTFVEYGMQLLEYKKLMQDPKTREEFISKMQSMMKDEKVFDWLNTMTEMELSGLAGAITIVKDTKATQSRLFP